jgi:hypothetical protein
MSRLGTLAQAVFVMSLAFGLGACEKDGPAERAGENIDNAVEEAGDKLEHAGDEVENKTDN